VHLKVPGRALRLLTYGFRRTGYGYRGVSVVTATPSVHSCFRGGSVGQ
jgi:hypothetical protein